MQNSVAMFNFSVFGRKYPFSGKLVQAIKIVNLSWNLVLGIIRIEATQWWCSFFSVFDRSILFCKFCSKNQNCVSWNLEPTYMDWKYPFWVYFIKQFKIQAVRNSKCQFKLNVVPRLFQVDKIRWWCSLFFLF